MSGSKMEKSERRGQLLDRYRYINIEHDRWWECVYVNFREDMQAVGIGVGRMFFSGFASQGDGACFEGSLSDAKLYLDTYHKDQFPMMRKLLEYDGDIYVKCSHTGRYYHQYCTDFWVDTDTMRSVLPCPTEFHEQVAEQWQAKLDAEVSDFETAVTEQWRNHMLDLYRRLEKEYDWLTSDEAVWEAIVANELDEDEDEDELEDAA